MENQGGPGMMMPQMLPNIHATQPPSSLPMFPGPTQTTPGPPGMPIQPIGPPSGGGNAGAIGMPMPTTPGGM